MPMARGHASRRDRCHAIDAYCYTPGNRVRYRMRGGAAVGLRPCCLCGCRLRDSARCGGITPRRRTAGAQTAGAAELLLACAPAVCVAAVCETRRGAAGVRRDGGRQELRPQARRHGRHSASLPSVWLPSARLGAMRRVHAETADGRSPDGRSPDGRGGGTAAVPASLPSVWLPSATLGAMRRDRAETADGRNSDRRRGGTAVACAPAISASAAVQFPSGVRRAATGRWCQARRSGSPRWLPR